MPTRAASPADGANQPVPLEGARHELQLVLESTVFANAPRLRALLSFLVEETICGHAAELKEPVVAVEVFGRPADFDHRTDSVVRVQIHNLRTKLHAYYAEEGKDHPLRIELPSGSYIPAFQPWPPAASEAPAGENAAPVAGRRPVRFPLPGVFWKCAAVAVVLTLCAAAWRFRLEIAPQWFAGSRSIAVLPFLNLTTGNDSEYFTQGVTEDLTTALAKVPTMRVAARTSAFEFRGKEEDVRKIGRQLGVEALLEGSVRREGNRVRLTAQLINAENGFHLWSDSYDQDVAGIQDMESSIVGAVAEALGARRPRPPGSPHVPPPEAREAYWRGRYLRADWQRFPESLHYFEQAVAADPQYADAWAALANVHASRMFQLVGPVDEEATKSREAAREALEFDESIPETHLAMAQVSCYHDHDWPACERSYRRALELNPSYAGGHLAYSLALTSQGRFDEAVAHLKLARQLDPISILSTNDLAVTLYCARRYDEAIRLAKQHLAMDPGFFLARVLIGRCEMEKGRVREAIAEMQKAVEQGERPIEFLGVLGNALARAGRLGEARYILAELQTLQKTKGTAGVAIARVSTGLGERGAAIQSLYQAAGAHVTDVMFIGVDPTFDPLRGEPEFQALCRQLGLPHTAMVRARR